MNKQNLTITQSIIITVTFLIVLLTGVILFSEYPINENLKTNSALMHVITFPIAYFSSVIILKFYKKTHTINISTNHVRILPLILITLVSITIIIYFPLNYIWLSKHSFKSIIGYGIKIDDITEGLIFAPIFEELVFRGIILKGLLHKYNVKKAILISALLFAIPHFSPVDYMKLPLVLIDGLFLGWVYYKSSSVLMPILMHFVKNLTILVVGSYFSSRSITSLEFLYGENTFIILTVLFISLILAMYYLYHYFKKHDVIQKVNRYAKPHDIE